MNQPRQMFAVWVEILGVPYGSGYLPRSQAALSPDMPKLWVTRAAAEASYQTWATVRTSAHRHEIVTFELRRVTPTRDQP